MFADDTNLFYSHKNLDNLVATVNQELQKISLWLRINKLSLNIKKTHFILFHFRQKKISSPVAIYIDKNKLEQVKETKFLGVIINENLTWSDHIDVVSNKCSKNLGIIRKLQKTVPRNILVTLYSTLIYPYLNYCNIAWASQPTTFLEKLYRVQKKAMRVITHSAWNTHSLPLFKTLNFLTIYDINKLQTACFVYSAIHSILPPTFSHYFHLNSLIHEHNTRSSSKFHSVYHSTSLRSYTVRIHAPKIWNALTAEIINAPTVYSFKKNINSHCSVNILKSILYNKVNIIKFCLICCCCLLHMFPLYIVKFCSRYNQISNCN